MLHCFRECQQGFTTNISVVNETKHSDFTFFLMTFFYSCCLFIDIAASWNNASWNYLIRLNFTRCCQVDNISCNFFWRAIIFQVVSPRVDDDCLWISNQMKKKTTKTKYKCSVRQNKNNVKFRKSKQQLNPDVRPCREVKKNVKSKILY